MSNSSLDNNRKGVSYNDCLAKGPNSLSPLFQVLITFRGYEHVVVWDLHKAYNTVLTGDPELHMRRLVWRWGDSSRDWTTFGFQVMTYGDRPAACGLEVAKEKVTTAGAVVCAETAETMKRGTYVDDSVGGGSAETVDRLIGEVRGVNGQLFYTGTVAQILALGGMRAKVMVRSGEPDPKIAESLACPGTLSQTRSSST